MPVRGKAPPLRFAPVGATVCRDTGTGPIRPHPRAGRCAGAGDVAAGRRGARRRAADGARPDGGADAGVAGDPGVRRADASLCDVGFLRRQCRRQLALGQAADLQNKRRVGQPRRLDADVGADPGAVRRGGRDLRHQPARQPACPRARHPGADRRRLFSLPAVHLESLRARLPRAARRQRPQSAAAGSRPRLPSAAALSRLCRLLGDLCSSPSPRCSRAASMSPGRAGCGRGRWRRGVS